MAHKASVRGSSVQLEITMTIATFPNMRTTKTNEVVVISHSNLIYWWPAWVLGYVMAALTALQGKTVALDGSVSYIHPSNNPGLLFIALIIGLIVFTNARLRGIYSVLTLLTVAFVAVVFAWFGWWDDILSFIPQLSAKANLGFYLVFSTTLLIVWIMSFFVFDRLSYWRVRPGQFSQVSMIGGGMQNYDTQGMRFERREQDYFRHILLGLGAGDMVFYGKEFNSGSIVIPNVTFISQKSADIERLIAIKPEA
jgi:hypothetical protein